MAIPTTDEVSLPVLQKLERGNLTTIELADAMIEPFHISDEERRETHPNGRNKLEIVIQFAVGQRMGDAGLVKKLSSQSGSYRYEITDIGREVLLHPPPIIDHRWLCTFSTAYNERYGKGKRKENKDGLSDNPEPNVSEARTKTATVSQPARESSYGVDDIVSDGCFVPKASIIEAMELLTQKKNLILQGPPGTGKTWLAKRLGYALLGEMDRDRVLAVQFHPSLSYEDFVRGWRFSDGKFALVDGVFLDMANLAMSSPNKDFVLVIEEINRGNPAQIFGEMLNLLEADKRLASEALRLTYPRGLDERFHIPSNLYVIGTMNLADRSLSLIDFAFRRRFAFRDLEPQLGGLWTEWCRKEGMPKDLMVSIADKLGTLNESVRNDKSLGAQFCIGHSFVTPVRGKPPSDWRAWFKRVIESEIGPLLAEYWYDSTSVAKAAKDKLLAGL